MIIFLNWPSSSWKTAILKAINFLSDKPFLNLWIDVLNSMVDDKYKWFWEHADIWYKFQQKHDKNWWIVDIRHWIFGKKFSKFKNKIIIDASKLGFDIIVDAVISNEKDIEIFKEKLSGYNPIFIFIFCPLKNLQERENLRWDRAWWLARGQWEKMKKFKFKYNLKIDTAKNTPMQIAKKILAYKG